MNKITTKATLLLAATMTVMAGAIIAPSLPQIAEVFENIPRIDLLTKLVLTLPALFIAIFSPIAGKIADSLGRLPLLMGSLLLYALGGAAAYLLNDVYLILVSRAVLGISVAGVMTATVTLAGDYFQGKERESFIGIQSAFMALGGVVFVIVGGLLADLSWRAPFLIYLLSLLSLPILLLAWWVLKEPARMPSKPANDTQERSSATALPGIVWLIYASVFTGMILFYMIPVQIPFLLKELGVVENTLSGVAIGTGTFFAAVASLSYRKLAQKMSFQTFFALAYLLIAVGYGLISISESFTTLLMSLGISGLGLGLLIPNTNIWLLSILPEKVRGFGMGLSGAFLFIGQFFSPIAVKPLVDAFSLSAAFGYAVILALLLSVLFTTLHFRKKHKKHQMV
ncbi:MFS transporter [Catalinimonas niigatensis]|uniref:MFS transporter n=1 Tax=Catalinimonas niigatensis TaxID=1397264 RepID=UPI002665277D|nr:MFS transporter [Catalinimonas niigatensis]WPP49085.1 MFS transporter [Catalinimonas niigatensis]